MSLPKKKVLIISYYWPPCGGIGVLRCLKISKYLRNFGWEPIIYTAKNAHYPNIDHSNEKDIAEGLTVLKQPIWEPYHLYKFFTGQKKDANVNNVFYVKEDGESPIHKLSVWIRSNFFIPDARARWIKPSVKYLKEYLEENPVDAIFSNGPPHSNTRIATLIKKELGIPWLADFQDPWSQVDYFKLLKLTSWGMKKHLKMEQEAFQYADKTTIVSPTWKGDLEDLGAHNVSVIPWGFDPDDYANLEDQVDSLMTLTHLGIMGYDRNPEVLLKVIAELGKELPDFSKLFRLKLVGQVDHSIKSLIEQLEVESMVDFVGSVDRGTALKMTKSSNILLLLLNQQDNAKGRIPGKLFEYLAVKRPILALGPANSDVAHIISESQGGKSLEYDDFEGLKKHLSCLFEAYNSNKLAEPINTQIEQYSIIKLTERIASFLDQITIKPLKS